MTNPTTELTVERLRSGCCGAEVRYRYCAKCGQECQVRQATDEEWMEQQRRRADASSYFAPIGRYKRTFGDYK